jgi:hypothetical protein
MKINKILLIFTAILFTTMACDDYLDLEPSQDISEDLALDTDKNVKSVLIGAYSIFDNPELYGGNILTWSELLGGDDEISWEGTYTGPREIFNKQINAGNEEVRWQWLSAYRTINIVNNVLSALAVVNEVDRDRVEGEALFLRSLMYFDLARYFGLPYEAGQTNAQLAVPLVLKPTRGITGESKVFRNTVEQVYSRVIDDLTIAAVKLPAINSVYATSGAAKALLARVYLQKGDYQAARDLADEVIGSATYTLRPNYAQVFNNDTKSTEDIFITEITNQDRWSAMTEFWSIPMYGGRSGDIVILEGHLSLYDPIDERLALFFTNAGRIFSGKWNNQYGVINIIRLAEMYLIRAEGNFRLSQEVGATPTEDINTLRERAGFGSNYFSSVTLDDILLERRLELAHEGHKIHDVKRLKQNVGPRLYNAPELVFPIPFREIEANENLIQNDGYN